MTLINEPCPSSSAIALDDLKNGDRLQCSTLMQNFVGELLLIDRRKGIFVLREVKGKEERQFNLHFIRFAELQSLKKLSSSPSSFGANLHVPTDCPATARDRLAKAEQRLGQLWVDGKLSEAARRTFVELKRIFDDVIWDGDRIKVLKCVLVTEPFDENGVQCLDTRTSSTNTLARVKKILARRRSSTCCSSSSSGGCSSTRTIPAQQQQCLSLSSTPSTLVQLDNEEEVMAPLANKSESVDLLQFDGDPSLSPMAADDLFLDAASHSSESTPKALSRTHCAVSLSPLRSPLAQCCSSSEELEMVTPPTID